MLTKFPCGSTPKLLGPVDLVVFMLFLLIMLNAPASMPIPFLAPPVVTLFSCMRLLFVLAKMPNPELTELPPNEDTVFFEIVLLGELLKIPA